MNDNPYGDDLRPTGGGGFVAYLPTILWQRRWWIIIPFLLSIAAAIAAYLLLPSVYRSTAVMVVESPQVATDLPGESGAELIDRRMARIHQQVTARPDLVELIEKHGLYASERKSKALSTVIEDMRESIQIEPTVAQGDPNDRRTKTIAFTLSYKYSEATRAQAVTQDLMQRVLDLDASGNAEAATNNVQFLTEQAQGLQTQIQQIEAQIATITAQNGAVLAQSPMINSSAGSYDVQIAQLQRDISTLQAQRTTNKSSAERDPVVVQAEAQLAAARAVYADGHPDVAIARQRLAEARQLAAQNVQKFPVDTVDQQIAFNNSQIAALRAAKARELQQTSATLSAQSRMPVVQQQITQLQQRLTGMNDQYKTVSAKLLAAQAGMRADSQELGERLAVVDPPVVPDAPEFPDRRIIAAGGVAAGLLLGFILAIAAELVISPIRDPNTVAELVGTAPLVVIPVVKPKIATKRMSFLRRRKTSRPLQLRTDQVE